MCRRNLCDDDDGRPFARESSWEIAVISEDRREVYAAASEE
jgi:hypothetical protein